MHPIMSKKCTSAGGADAHKAIVSRKGNDEQCEALSGGTAEGIQFNVKNVSF